MSSNKEALSIPKKVRKAVDERDGRFCRLCGSYEGERRLLHHVVYGGDDRGMGGRRRHVVEEIVTLGWGCHERAHRDKHLWQDLLLEAIQRPGTTALQLLRWRHRQNARSRVS